MHAHRKVNTKKNQYNSTEMEVFALIRVISRVNLDGTVAQWLAVFPGFKLGLFTVEEFLHSKDR